MEGGREMAEERKTGREVGGRLKSKKVLLLYLSGPSALSDLISCRFSIGRRMSL